MSNDIEFVVQKLFCSFVFVFVIVNLLFVRLDCVMFVSPPWGSVGRRDSLPCRVTRQANDAIGPRVSDIVSTLRQTDIARIAHIGRPDVISHIGIFGVAWVA